MLQFFLGSLFLKQIRSQILPSHIHFSDDLSWRMLPPQPTGRPGQSLQWCWEGKAAVARCVFNFEHGNKFDGYRLRLDQIHTNIKSQRLRPSHRGLSMKKNNNENQFPLTYDTLTPTANHLFPSCKCPHRHFALQKCQLYCRKSAIHVTCVNVLTEYD